MMKKILCAMLALLMLMTSVGALAETFWYDSTGRRYTNTFDETIRAKALMRIATRSGPGTNYDGLGSYHKKGYVLEVISKAWDDANGIWWLQVELKYGSQYRRAYTGLKRVNVNINAVPEESLLYGATVKAAAPAYYGPGTQYTQHKNGMEAGVGGWIYAVEDGWALFECYNAEADQFRRVWLPMQYLNIRSVY